MHKVIILGSGNIGFTVALLLSNSEEYEVTLVSRHKRDLNTISKKLNIKIKVYDFEKNQNYSKLLKPFDTVISALPFI